MNKYASCSSADQTKQSQKTDRFVLHIQYVSINNNQNQNMHSPILHIHSKHLAQIEWVIVLHTAHLKDMLLFAFRRDYVTVPLSHNREVGLNDFKHGNLCPYMCPLIYVCSIGA